MSLLTREAILGAKDIQTEDVAVPEWGGSVRITTLTGEQRDEFEQAIVKSRGTDVSANMRNIRARLVCASAVDEAGKPLFPAINDVERLGQKSAKALGRVYDAAAKLSGLTKEDVEDLAKNSDSGQSEDSGSDSAAN